MTTILAIDDDKDILILMKRALEREGYFVDTLQSTKDVTQQKLQFADLILLDIMMPDEDGFSYCEKIRQQVDCPILFVTARTEEQDLIHGLGLGADDYIQKPFTIGELRARVSAHLRREKRQPTHLTHSGDFSLNIGSKELFYDKTLLNLTKSQFEICAFLIENAGNVFSKEQLFESVFGMDSDSDVSIIVEHIKNCRAKFKQLGIDPIETVWGIGYKWKKEKV